MDMGVSSACAFFASAGRFGGTMAFRDGRLQELFAFAMAGKWVVDGETTFS
jgi:hypothetical protein